MRLLLHLLLGVRRKGCLWLSWQLGGSSASDLNRTQTLDRISLWCSFRLMAMRDLLYHDCLIYADYTCLFMYWHFLYRCLWPGVVTPPSDGSEMDVWYCLHSVGTMTVSYMQTCMYVCFVLTVMTVCIHSFLMPVLDRLYALLYVWYLEIPVNICIPHVT